MGYRSNVAIATTKEVYDRLIKEAPEDTKYLFKMCDEYYTSTYQPTIYDRENVDFIPNGPEETIIILRWHWIKRYAEDYAFIEKFIQENEGCILEVADVASENDGCAVELASIASENNDAILELAEYIDKLEKRITILESEVNA